MPRVACSRISYYSTNILFTKYIIHNQLSTHTIPLLSNFTFTFIHHHLLHQHYLFLSCMVLVFFHVTSFIPQPYPSQTLLPTLLLYLSQTGTWFHLLLDIMLDTLTIRIPGGPTNRRIGLFVDDEWSLEREADGEGFARGTQGGAGLCVDRKITGCLAGFLAASRASLSTLSAFRRLLQGIAVSLFFSRRKRSASSWVWAFILSRVTKGVKNGDDDGLGQKLKLVIGAA